MELTVDPERVAMLWREADREPRNPHDTPDFTGIQVRAKFGDKWGSHDIAMLTRASLKDWLRSRGGENEWAESVVYQLLRYADD